MDEDKLAVTGEDLRNISEASEKFLTARKPMTAGEVRRVLTLLYVQGIKSGVTMARMAIEEI
jgi:hypothetical protein